MANIQGPAPKVEYWSPYGNQVVCWLEGVSVRLMGTPFENASDPDWFVSVDGNPATKVQSIYYKADDGSPWDAKVHSALQFPGTQRAIYFHFEHIGTWNHDDTIWQFQHWDGSVWRATIATIPNYTGAMGNVQPTFDLVKLK